MTEINRKKNTGEPTTNGGEFGSKPQAEADVSLTKLDPLDTHLAFMSEEAGLGGVMPGILGVLRDRGSVTDKALFALTADDISGMYFDFVGAAVDRIESRVNED